MGGLLGLQRQVGNSAVVALVQRTPDAKVVAQRRGVLDPVQGLAMHDLLRRLAGLPVDVHTDYDAGLASGGPRLVLAMKAVAARGRPWNAFVVEHSFKMDAGTAASPLPEDQLIDIVAFLGGPADYRAHLQLPQWPEKFALATGPGALPADMRVRVARQALANRAAVPIRADLKPMPGGGFQYAGDTGAFRSPSASRLERIARDEILHEGGPTAVNTFDNNRPPLTLGAGFLQQTAIGWISTWLGGDPASREKFRLAGLDVGGGKIQALQADGSVVEGAAAMGVFAADAHLLSLFMTTGEDPAAKTKVVDAQVAVIRANHINAAAQAADKAKWSDTAIAVCMHITHWLPAFGWGANKDEYLATNGDLLAIVKTFGRLAGVTRGSGAVIVGNGDNRCTTPFSGSHFDVFGAGVGQPGAARTAAVGAGTKITSSLEEIDESEDNKGQLLFRLGPPANRTAKVDWLRLPQR
ncbi:hypothetical protein FHS29_002592 [Saccharothrix tamanrassetensis]|uniref:Uncharacterized protein n=1 Tax=Saccharothrix tamanrassetensis TaxID=1051531 RepID=A0A841CFC2_9PSEU|nr:hypothetical protein [Saccharothrix tamanrassetensis]MBB5956011.1 hypothetical protein [Saccharothrix tamanrassetensis]